LVRLPPGCGIAARRLAARRKKERSYLGGKSCDFACGALQEADENI
jgi:hypothetical protein